MGAGDVTRTNATSGARSDACTIIARCLKPPKSSLSSEMSSAIASRNPPPVILPMPRRIIAADFARRFSESLPLDSNALMNHCIAELSSAPMSRSGASKKSSAFAVGGVSRTTRSYLGSFLTATSFSIAMYSCVPAKDVETYLIQLVVEQRFCASLGLARRMLFHDQLVERAFRVEHHHRERAFASGTPTSAKFRGDRSSRARPRAHLRSMPETTRRADALDRSSNTRHVALRGSQRQQRQAPRRVVVFPTPPAPTA